MPPEGQRFPALVVAGRRFEWANGAQLNIGRDPGSDIVVDGPRVSRLHAVIAAVGDGWVIRDANSRNGTFHDGVRIDELTLDRGVDIGFGSAIDGTSLRIELAPSVAAGDADQLRVAGDADPLGDAGHAYPPRDRTTRPGVAASEDVAEPLSELGQFKTVHRPSVARFRIGRTPDNDLALENDPRASRHHAELRQLADGRVELVDLNSHNGTFVNGRRIDRVVVGEDDTIAIGNHVFRYHNGALEEFAQSDGANLDVAGVKVVVDGSTLLEGVSFSLASRSVLAVVGPSGAGKTTLLRALTGFARPTHGAIRFGGRDLYADYDELRARIGYVPQQDLVHEQLTVRQELEFAGALRLPPDLGRAGIRQRAAEVMTELGLSARAELPIEKLSGGQRKRVSVGVELLTEPALLYLDEPTSGLDPGNERQVMQVLRDLADDGRIVVVVTHSTQSIEVADRVLFLATGGHMAYFGPPEDAERYFERNGIAGGWPAVFKALEGGDSTTWAEMFRRDEDFARFAGVVEAQAPAPVRVMIPSPSSTPTGPVGVRLQTGILCRRQLRLISGDRRSVLLLAVQAPLFGLILTFLFPSKTLSTSRGPFAALLEWLLVVSATWLGASNTIREVVKEQSIFRRERAAGLSTLAYCASKVLVFGAITVVQSFIVLVIVLLNQPLPPKDPTHIVTYLQRYGALAGLRPFSEGSVIASQQVEVFLAMALAGLAGMAIGLLISSAVRKSDQAVFMLPVVLIVEMALSQPLLQLQNPSALLKGLGDLTSANWGINAVASSTSLNQLMTSYQLSLYRGTDEVKQYLGFPTSVRTQHAQAIQSLRGSSAWTHQSGTYLLAIFVILLMTAIFLGGFAVMMRRLDTGTPRSLFERALALVGGSRATSRPSLSTAGAPSAERAGTGRPPPPPPP